MGAAEKANGHILPKDMVNDCCVWVQLDMNEFPPNSGYAKRAVCRTWSSMRCWGMSRGHAVWQSMMVSC